MVSRNTNVADIFKIFEEAIPTKPDTPTTEFPSVGNFLYKFLSLNPENEFTQKRKTPYWRASAIKSDMCPRFEVFCKSSLVPYLSIPQLDFPAKMILAAGDGTDVHARLQNDYLGPAGVLYGKWRCPHKFCAGHNDVFLGFLPDLKVCQFCGATLVYEEPVLKFPKHNIVGHCDGFLYLDNSYYIVDFKTFNPWAFKNLTELPKKYYDQIMLYAYGVTRGFCDVRVPLKGAIVYYQVRDEYKQFNVELDFASTKKVLKSVEDMNFYLRREKRNSSLPNRHPDCAETNAKGKKCPFKEMCYSCETSFNVRDYYVSVKECESRD